MKMNKKAFILKTGLLAVCAAVMLGSCDMTQRDKRLVGGIVSAVADELEAHAEPAGSVELTLRLISILRLMLPTANIPATTSLGTLATDGRERGILAGANVVMPNLSPVEQRKKYSLYDNKICTGDEAAESRRLLERRIEAIGYTLV